MSDSNHKPLFHLDHPRPVSRRDFLSQGLIRFSALAMAPTALSFLFRSSNAYADCLAEQPMSSLIPFMVFDMAGGAALPANFLVGKRGGAEDLLKSYNTLGWNPRDGGAIDTSFGAPMSAKFSKILEGIKSTASPNAQAALRMGTFCNFSRDDTSANPLSILTLVSRLGYKGSFVQSGTGTNNSSSGGNSEPVLKELAFKPLPVSTVNDIMDSVNFGPAFLGGSMNSLKAAANGMMNLSVDQAKKLASLDPSDIAPGLAGAAYKKNISYVDKPAGLDPRKDVIFSKIYNLTEDSNASDEATVFASVAMNAIKGNTGPGAITIGGCDYHDGTQTTGDRKDLQMGQEIGRAIEGAYQLNRPFAFQLLTDGGTYAKEGTRQWQGDSGDRSLTVFGFMNPVGPAKMIRTQVGNYTDGQGIDRETLIGNRPDLAAYSVFANYMNVCGLMKDFECFAPRGTFTPDQLKSVLLMDV